MLNLKKSRILSIFFYSFVFFFISNVFAQNMDIINKMAESVNQRILLKEYDKGFNNALFILKNYKNQEMPLDIEDTCERAIKAWFNYLEEEKRWKEIIESEKQVAELSVSMKKICADYVRKAYSKTNETPEIAASPPIFIQQPEKESQKDSIVSQENIPFDFGITQIREIARAASVEQQKYLSKIMKEMREMEMQKEKSRSEERQLHEKNRIELENKRIEAESDFRKYIGKVMEDNNRFNNKFFIMGFVLFAVFIFTGMLFFIINSYLQRKAHKDIFKNAFALFKRNDYESSIYEPSRFPPAQDIIQIAEKQTLLIENGTETDGISLNLIGKLITECEKYGKQIDSVTCRKNTSRRVAEIVYKISKYMGYTEKESMLHFAASMVYDIGFLTFDSSFFCKDYISGDEFEKIKTHTEKGVSMLFFVDESVQSLFKDAVLKHHENIDGTGYPSCLKDEYIPYIARVIHVAESFVALVSNRNYREIMDRNKALEELYGAPGVYDMEIVKVLDEII